jgi:hypothetical protein
MFKKIDIKQNNNKRGRPKNNYKNSEKFKIKENFNEIEKIVDQDYNMNNKLDVINVDNDINN